MLGSFMYNDGPWGMNHGVFGPMDGFGLIFGAFFGLLMMVLVVWTIYWKYYAVWYAVKHDHKWWVLALLVVNTAGILEILYLYVFSKKMDAPPHDESKTPMVPPQQ